ncbi:unnamed protein product [Calypogeia fissa]
MSAKKSVVVHLWIFEPVQASTLCCDLYVLLDEKSRNEAKKRVARELEQRAARSAMSGDAIKSPAEEQEWEHEHEAVYVRALQLELPPFWQRRKAAVELFLPVETPRIRGTFECLKKNDVLGSNENVQTLTPDAVQFLAKASYMFTLELIFRAWVMARECKADSIDTLDIICVVLDVLRRRDTFLFPTILLQQHLEEQRNNQFIDGPSNDDDAAITNGRSSNGTAEDTEPERYGPMSMIDYDAAARLIESKFNSLESAELPPDDDDGTATVEPNSRATSDRQTRNWPTSSDSSSDSENGDSTRTWLSSSTESSSDDNSAASTGMHQPAGDRQTGNVNAKLRQNVNSHQL